MNGHIQFTIETQACPSVVAYTTREWIGITAGQYGGGLLGTIRLPVSEVPRLIADLQKCLPPDECPDCEGTGAAMGLGTSAMKGMCEACDGSGQSPAAEGGRSNDK